MFEFHTKNEGHDVGDVPAVNGFSDDGESPLLNNDYIEESHHQYETPRTTVSYYNGRKGERQPDRFNDKHFAIAFLAHLGVVVYYSFKPNSDVEVHGVWELFAHSGPLLFILGTAFFATMLSSLAMLLMMKHPRDMIKACIYFVICSNAVIFMFSYSFASSGIGIIGIISAAYCIYWSYTAWSRVPFAAANLQVAITAVKANQKGLAIIAFSYIALMCVWVFLWSVVSGGIVYNNDHGSMVSILCLLSYYWTYRVLENTVQVTTVGVIGTWWFEPEESTSSSSHSSTIAFESLKRATTYSFGSICYGSLLSAFCQVLRSVHRKLRNIDDIGALGCLVQCFLACIEEVIEYLNKYAYVYVGLYGYSYLEAGKNVIQLFTNRGWSVLYTETLCDFLFLMLSYSIGLFTGLFGWVLLTGPNIPFLGLVFIIMYGSVIGFVTSSVIMSVVSGAVNTIVVSYAESPAEFEQSHPELSRTLREAWAETHPEE